MKLHLKSPGGAPGVHPLVKRGRDLKHLSFAVIELGGNLREHSFHTGEEEVALDFYTGPVEVSIESDAGRVSYAIPERKSVANVGPMVFAPGGAKIRLRALNGSARISVGGALGHRDVEPRCVEGAEVMTKSVGDGNWSRTVYTHIAENVPAAHLICGETVNQPGGWSSYPPHKHDQFRKPSEVPMEEVYYFQFDPPQGFGFMRVYTEPGANDAFDLAFAVEHGDTVMIPRGYHPVAAGPGYTLNYTWILAGEGRTYGAWADDPQHAWIKAR